MFLLHFAVRPALLHFAVNETCYSAVKPALNFLPLLTDSEASSRPSQPLSKLPGSASCWHRLANPGTCGTDHNLVWSRGFGRHAAHTPRITNPDQRCSEVVVVGVLVMVGLVMVVLVKVMVGAVGSRSAPGIAASATQPAVDSQSIELAQHVLSSTIVGNKPPKERDAQNT